MKTINKFLGIGALSLALAGTVNPAYADGDKPGEGDSLYTQNTLETKVDSAYNEPLYAEKFMYLEGNKVTEYDYLALKDIYLFLYDEKVAEKALKKDLQDEVIKISNDRVVKLDLSGYNLNEIPKSIGNLTNLYFLYLSNNALRSLPFEISNLKELVELDLSGNMFEYMSRQIGELENLRELYISDNKIKAIPEELCKLKNIRKMDFKNNNIGTVPVCFSNFSDKTFINLERNGLKSENFPNEIRTSPLFGTNYFY